MKRLGFGNRTVRSGEALTREQLRNVLGGTNRPLTGCTANSCSNDNNCDPGGVCAYNSSGAGGGTCTSS